ncbi:MAG: class I SAM-dependent methyltransferase [Candidatus Gottesmanbacteria bacterium]|nr:class I SAM-dependent methyltransferase [Candidatus Gottesmanbacteria bacterium]
MTRCRACGHPITEFFSLGAMPPVNAFLKKKDIPNERSFDLSVGFCQKCYLVQLLKIVDPKDLFRHYLYFSSTTQSIIEYSKTTAYYLIQRLKLGRGSLVVEIGSNDGVHLRWYQKAGIKVLGIDPARNVAAEAIKKGIPTKTAFFGHEVAKELARSNIHADLLYGANVLAHIPDILGCVRGVSTVLKKTGTAVFESPYIGGLFENKFDTIYHEHVFYYSLLALQNLFARANLCIYDCEFVHMQGGSLRIFVCHEGMYSASEQVRELVDQEHQHGFHRLSSYLKIRTNVEKLRTQLTGLLKKLKKDGKRVAAYGAPAKGMVLLNYFRLGKFLDFIADKSEAKQGLYTPGTHFLIYPPSKVVDDRPDYVLILPWNISDEVMGFLTEYQKKGGKFIIPVPDVIIV